MYDQEPDFYDRKLSEEPSRHREVLEGRLADAYANLKELSGIPKLKEKKRIEVLEQTLSWQGANPKQVPFDELKEHVQSSHGSDVIGAKYRARINNRTTATRAYCVTSCMGDDVAAVRECSSITCPLYPFRMGKDPFRGYAMPEVADIIIEDDADDDLEDNDD